jgi:hypothetical protein
MFFHGNDDNLKKASIVRFMKAFHVQMQMLI